MKIDEDRIHVLSKYRKVNGQTVVTESDHNPLICQFNQIWSSHSDEEKQRYEVFNFTDPEGVIKFNELTSSDTLSSCIDSSDVRRCSKKWLKAFKNILHRSFKKIRVSNKQIKNEAVHNLMNAKNKLLNKIKEISEEVHGNSENIE
jgi:hypothetical protein